MPRWLLTLALVCAPCFAARAGAAAAFQVDYVVHVTAADPAHVQVTWRLAGIDEIAHFRLRFRDDRTTAVTGSGRLEWHDRELRWTPDGPYAHLTYTVAVDRHRPAGGAHFDSHAEPTWIATRTTHLFPEINVDFRAGVAGTQPAARLIFELPKGWHSAATGERIAPNVYRVAEAGRLFLRPRGWILLGAIEKRLRTVAGLRITVALAPGTALDPRRLLHLYGTTLPQLTTILGPPPPRLLVVSAPDPMWHGGLSGEESFFVNGHIPLHSADHTSTYLHELFHVWAPFDVRDDGHWVSEGLAEYYTLLLQRRAGRLTDDRFARGIALFHRYGRWQVDLSRTRVPAALNNSAPAVMHALDGAIRDASGGAHGIDDAVRALIAGGRSVTTARWLAAVNHAAGRDLAPFFRKFVFGGAQPPLPDASHP